MARNTYIYFSSITIFELDSSRIWVLEFLRIILMMSNFPHNLKLFTKINIINNK